MLAYKGSVRYISPTNPLCSHFFGRGSLGGAKEALKSRWSSLLSAWGPVGSGGGQCSASITWAAAAS